MGSISIPIWLILYGAVGAFFTGIAHDGQAWRFRPFLVGLLWPFVILSFLGFEAAAVLSRHFWLHGITTVVESEGAAFPLGTSFHRIMGGKLKGQGWTLYFAVPHFTDKTSEEEELDALEDHDAIL